MLQQLSIRNYAIIEDLQIHFKKGLSIITGETGAGKSILMGALNLILGQRAETGVLLNKDLKCIVEAVFVLPGTDAHLLGYLQSLDIEHDDPELIIRREISPAGKSRSFINDSPVSLNQLKSVASLLVDLHQQFDTRELNEADFQRSVLDALAGNKNLLSQMMTAFSVYRELLKKVSEAKEQRDSFQKELDYNNFLFEELLEAALQTDELELLDAELHTLTHAEEAKSLLQHLSDEINEGDTPLSAGLKSLVQKLKTLPAGLQGISDITDRLAATAVELKDIGEEIAALNNNMQANPDRLEVVNDRIALGYRLLKKHNVKTTAELLLIQSQLDEKLQAYQHGNYNIEILEKKLQKALADCDVIAINLSKKRKEYTEVFRGKTEILLHEMGMPNARLKIEIEPASLHAFGYDEVRFLFDANAIGQFQPIAKVASGGELSRLMLAIKSLVAHNMALPTLIFDEIDTGISGEAARKVGAVMRDLSSQHQLIVISHQPQVAAKADTHFYVHKHKGSSGSIQTQVKVLSDKERVETIAKMIGGDKPSVAAMQNAAELIAH